MSTPAARHDLLVVGGGPGGYAAALYAASAGLDVGLVEKSKLGGTCLHAGCIPAKELLETAAVYRTVQGAERFGITVGPPVLEMSPVLDMSAVQARKQEIIDRLNKGVATLLKGRKVTVYDGLGSLGTDRTVTVTAADGEQSEIGAAHIVLATGSVPRSIGGFEVDGQRIFTSDELLNITEVPTSAAVIGGGAIGLEFASLLSDLGSQVTVLEALSQILPGADDDVTKLLARAFKKRGIDIRTGVQVIGQQTHSDRVRVELADADPLEVDVVVVCVGRRPFTEGLGLESTAVVVDERGFVVVDEYCSTAEPGVYAVGDVIDTPQLAHVGFAEAMLVVQHLLGESPTPLDYRNVPWAIYCHPEVAFVGHTEVTATEAGHEVVTSLHRYAGNSRAAILGETDGLVKLVAERTPDGGAGQILGVHMVGPWVTEQIGQGYLAVNWEATVGDVAAFVQPHPTLSELFGETVLALSGRALH